jgi:hypothetical protein
MPKPKPPAKTPAATTARERALASGHKLTPMPAKKQPTPAAQKKAAGVQSARAYTPAAGRKAAGSKGRRRGRPTPGHVPTTPVTRPPRPVYGTPNPETKRYPTHVPSPGFTTGLTGPAYPDRLAEQERLYKLAEAQRLAGQVTGSAKGGTRPEPGYTTNQTATPDKRATLTGQNTRKITATPPSTDKTGVLRGPRPPQRKTTT